MRKARSSGIPGIFAAIAIAGLLGCGGGGGQSTGSASGSSSGGGSSSGEGGVTQLSSPEFVEQGNAACAQQKSGASERLAIYIKVHKPEGLPEAELGKRALNVAIVSTAEAELAALRKLEPPASEKKKVEAALVAEEAAIKKGNKGETKLELPATENLFAASNRQLKALGLDKCVVSS